MPTIQILIVEKAGTLKPLKLKDFAEEDLYKKAGFKTNEGFELATTWSGIRLTDDNTYSVSLYGKQSGRAGQENKYDFPPPVDSILFFGNCLLVLNSGDQKETKETLTIDLWTKIYEHLFGGFEDVGSNDSEEESEDDSEDDLLPKTKAGYAKDGFVVDDSASSTDDEPDEDSGDSEEDIPVVKKKNKKTNVTADGKKPSVKKNINNRKKTVFDNIETVVIDTVLAEDIQEKFLDCSDELLEEAYL